MIAFLWVVVALAALAALYGVGMIFSARMASSPTAESRAFERRGLLIFAVAALVAGVAAWAASA